MSTCPKGYASVPAHCRKKHRGPRRQPQSTQKELSMIRARIKELRPLVGTKGEKVPLIGLMPPLKTSLHAKLDTTTTTMMVALFKLPIFFPGALDKMMKASWRQRYPDPVVRYEKIKLLFCKKFRVKELPAVYEYVLLYLCLQMAAASRL